jgi:hypothetical protein
MTSKAHTHHREVLALTEATLINMTTVVAAAAWRTAIAPARVANWGWAIAT